MLQGSLDTVSLDEVLGFLASSSKTGVLRLSGDRGTGSVWVQDGQIVSADATHGGNEPALEEVIFELLRFSAGTFAFDFDETSASAGSPMAIEGVLAQANKLLVEWRGIELVVPGLDYRATPTPSLPADQVTITADEWATLLAVGANASVEEVSNGLGLGELEGLRRLKGLIERKLVLLSEPRSSAGAGEPAITGEPKAREVVDEEADEVSIPEPVAAPDFQAPPVEASPVEALAVESDSALHAPTIEEPYTVPGEYLSDPDALDVPPPIAPSARRLSVKRGSVPVPETPEVAPPPAPPAPANTIPVAQSVEESMEDPFAPDEVRPPMPPPPPMPSAPTGMVPPSGADVPPPPSPPSPAEIAKFGSSIEDASSIEESSKTESSLLMRYLQSES